MIHTNTLRNFVHIVLLLIVCTSCKPYPLWYEVYIEKEPMDVLAKKYENEVKFIYQIFNNPDRIEELIISSPHYLNDVTKLNLEEKKYSYTLPQLIKITKNPQIQDINILNHYHRHNRTVYNDCAFISIWLECPNHWDENCIILYIIFAKNQDKSILLDMIIFDPSTHP